MMGLTIKQYRSNAGWSIAKLAQEAKISFQAASNAEEGKPVRAATAKAIADALSRQTGEVVKVVDIEGLNIL